MNDLKISKISESEKVIKSSAEIPQVLKEENVKQPVIYLNNIVKGKKRNVVLLGETHIATKGEEHAACRILPYFKYIGCEGVDVEGFIEGRFFFWVMDHMMSPVISMLSFWERRSKKNKSPIEKAHEYSDLKMRKALMFDKAYECSDLKMRNPLMFDKAHEYSDLKTTNILMLEKGWKPSIRARIFFVTFPLLFIGYVFLFAINSVSVVNNHGGWWFLIYIFSIVLFVELFDNIPVLKYILGFVINLAFDYVFDIGPSRDRNMTKNLNSELNKNETIDEIIVLTGSNHTRPIAKILKNKYGFVENADRI